MIKLAEFHNHEEICITHDGASYCTCTWATQKAEEFINKPNIEVVDIKYARSNNDTSILVIYREKEKEKVC